MTVNPASLAIPAGGKASFDVTITRIDWPAQHVPFRRADMD